MFQALIHDQIISKKSFQTGKSSIDVILDATLVLALQNLEVTHLGFQELAANLYLTPASSPHPKSLIA